MREEAPLADDAAPGLYAALADRARRSSDLALALCLGGGAAGVIAILGTGARWWTLVFPLGALAAFGLWGIADRERATAMRPGVRDAATAVRWVAVVAGTACGAATAVVVLGKLLGTVIS